MNGAKFSHGFISAGITKGIGTPLNDRAGNQVVAGTLVSATIGGTTSSIVGGKFANGAVTGVFQALFNRFGSDIWNQKNVRTTIQIEAPVGTPFLDYYYEGEWETIGVSELDISDLIPGKSKLRMLRIATFAQEQSELLQ
ncbi:hypothetical protein CWE06_12355 [Aliidiomarina haloalkalitolerans]|mgnify:CR=1 FL=1|uniref:Uncharacterized protein n=1 Tax=Aliidiomarina haloalkalitolerans TaxID=859059 RepID=A0A432VPB3_9GAMM|nr:hypothetical protein CWE06_12355 [Aliidiomarina haloalkalitolerans]